MKFLILALFFAPTVWEIINDRHGETKKDKLVDSAVFVVVVGLIAGLSYWLGQSPVATILLVLGIRVMFFDYAIQYILIKNKVIVGHWFTYNGKTSWFDKLASKVNPWVRLIARIVVFALAVWWYCTSL